MINLSKDFVKICPSIAAGDLMNLSREVQRLEEGGADAIHFDVMDGHFVPLLTIGVPFVEQMKKITSLPLDVHIMVSNPDNVFQNYIDAGADILTFHAETAKHAHRIINSVHKSNAKCGLALNPGTHWRDIEFLLSEVDQVTIMAVNPGFSRQKHLAFVHEKIKQLAEFRLSKALSFCIQVDGGVTKENIRALVELGASVFVAGGAVFNELDYGVAIQQLKNKVTN